MRGECRLRPFVEDAFGGAGNELLGALGDQAHDLRAGIVVKAARGEDLRDLLAELAIALQCFLHVLSDCLCETLLYGRSVPSTALGIELRPSLPGRTVLLKAGQRLRQRAVDRAADSALQIFVGRALEGGVRGDMRFVCRRVACLRRQAKLGRSIPSVALGMKLRPYTAAALREHLRQSRKIGCVRAASLPRFLQCLQTGGEHFAKRRGIFAQHALGELRA